jgi:hypothetical protein
MSDIQKSKGLEALGPVHFLTSLTARASEPAHSRCSLPLNLGFRCNIALCPVSLDQNQLTGRNRLTRFALLVPRLLSTGRVSTSGRDAGTPFEFTT